MKLHIGNLAKSVSEPQLKELVVAFAQPETLELITDHSGASKGFAFAEFASDDQARAVMTGLNGKEIDGQVLKVGEARPRKGDVAKATA